MTIETIAMLSALFFMFAAVLAKVTTLRLLVMMRQLVKTIQIQKMELAADLKEATLQYTIAERNKTSIERKMAKREKKLRSLKRELREYLSDEERKKLKREDMKKQLST